MTEIQRNKIPLFPKGARVCFVGDSLTACTFWTELIHEHYLKVYPDCELRVYNAAIGGITIPRITKFFDKDIMVWKPTHVVIMFGANDMGLHQGSVEERINSFANALCEFARKFTAQGITAYFMVEPNYSYDNDNDTGSNCFVWWKAVQKASEIMDTYYCDLYSLITPYFKKCFNKVIADGIHFTYEGECLVSKLFLYSQGFDIDIENEEYMMQRENLTYYGDHKNIFDRKLRAMWLAEGALFEDMADVSIEEKRQKAMEHMREWYGKKKEKWTDFYYYRAVDYLEMSYNEEFYRQRIEDGIDYMIEDAKKQKKED